MKTRNKLISLAFSLFVLLSCSEEQTNEILSENTSKGLTMYDVLIEYNRKNIKNNFDSLYVNFQSGFEGEQIVVKIDNKIFFKDIISSDNRTGLAKSISIPEASAISILEVYIKNGKPAVMLLDRNQRLIAVDFFEESSGHRKLRLSSRRSFPIYE